VTEKKSDKPDTNLAVRVASDPTLITKIFPRLKDPQYHISDTYEEEIKNLRGIHSTEKGVLISKVTTPEDYQFQLKLLSAIQHCLDQLHEINTNLYVIQSRYKDLLNAATKVIMLTYFEEINNLKEGMRKIVLNIALAPIQDGFDKLQSLIDLGEATQKHLMASNWNIKEGTTIIRDYLSLYKFGSNVRVPPNRDI